jgi:tetratricopeptide (TPR) repeat protein
MAHDHRPLSVRAIGAAAAALVALLATPPASGAQQLTPKPALSGSALSGCRATTESDSPREESAEVRQLFASGQDAALQGDHVAARQAFQRAASLAPGSARIAYYLGRAHEDLSERPSAIMAYCRYLALAPSGANADEVRGRILRLTPVQDLRRSDEARAAFRSGLTLLGQRQFEPAAAAFGNAAQLVPNAPEAVYNRGLARAAAGDRRGAVEDLKRYLETTPDATEELQLRAVIARLEAPVPAPKTALFQGLVVPGLGQFYTGRPTRGLAVLGLVAGAVVLGARSKESNDVRSFTDPFGNPYSDTIAVSRQPYLAGGIAVAALLWGGAAWESSRFARRMRTSSASLVVLSPSSAASTIDGPRFVIGVRVPLRGFND